MVYSIEIKNLTYKYSAEQIVLDNINLHIPFGSIYGFLGPNGAGKTTTLRLIFGLLKKQGGSINIFNKDFAKDRIDILRNIGSLIESPSLYGHLTAKENLEILQKIYQCPKSRIAEVLDIAGLSETGNKKTAQFSLGMKQRLSIAIALLHKPKLLILDEPTNGLDPNGIIEVRELLKKMNTEDNMTIVISSHLLAEIEKMVTHVGIISKGKLLFEGTLQELQQKQTLNAVICFDTNNQEITKNIIIANGLIPTLHNGILSIPVIEKKRIANLTKLIVEQNVEVYQVSKVQDDLESIFIDLVKT